MSGPEGQAPPGGGGGAPSEEELRAAYEAELARITAVDMIAQSTVSLLNIGAHRMGPPPGAQGAPGAEGRDLEQVKDSIDAARALLAVLERRIPREIGPLKDALSRLQMAYAQEVGAGAGQPAADAGGASGGEASRPDTPQAQPQRQQDRQPAEPEQGGRGPGPAESSGRLWVPGR